MRKSGFHKVLPQPQAFFGRRNKNAGCSESELRFSFFVSFDLFLVALNFRFHHGFVLTIKQCAGVVNLTSVFVTTTGENREKRMLIVLDNAGSLLTDSWNRISDGC
jgi:hypothetical protein